MHVARPTALRTPLPPPLPPTPHPQPLRPYYRILRPLPASYPCMVLHTILYPPSPLRFVLAWPVEKYLCHPLSMCGGPSSMPPLPLSFLTVPSRSPPFGHLPLLPPLGHAQVPGALGEAQTGRCRTGPPLTIRRRRWLGQNTEYSKIRDRKGAASDTCDSNSSVRRWYQVVLSRASGDDSMLLVVNPSLTALSPFNLQLSQSGPPVASAPLRKPVSSPPASTDDGGLGQRRVSWGEPLRNSIWHYAMSATCYAWYH